MNYTILGESSSMMTLGETEPMLGIYNFNFSEDGNYVTYYKIFYSPSCHELFLVNMTFVSVTSHQSTTTFSFILRELFSGMNYTITVRAGNVLGESRPVMILGETELTSGIYNL